MNTKEYYIHARSLGPFRAIECLRMAREAATLAAAKRKANYLPQWVDHEVLPNGMRIRFSNPVRVF